MNGSCERSGLVAAQWNKVNAFRHALALFMKILFPITILSLQIFLNISRIWLADSFRPLPFIINALLVGGVQIDIWHLVTGADGCQEAFKSEHQIHPPMHTSIMLPSTHHLSTHHPSTQHPSTHHPSNHHPSTQHPSTHHPYNHYPSSIIIQFMILSIYLSTNWKSTNVF